MHVTDRLRAKITPYYMAVAILVLNAVVIVGALELTSRAMLNAWSGMVPQEESLADARERSSYYASQDWAQQYWKEFGRARKQRYHAFTVWRRAAFTGETINIDARGVRATPGSDCGPGAFRVFMFGSSQMWGTGAPDWGTIPAYFAAGLKKFKREPICVTNFGESGYVSTQSVIELMLQISSGNVPDVAVFYDGAADIYTGYQSGRAGAIHENFDQTAAKVEQRDVTRWPLIVQLVRSMSLFRLVNNQVARLSATPDAGSANLLTYETMNVDRAALANTIAESYLGNYRAVDALARKYGFSYYFFWPPHVSKGKKLLTDEEEAEKAAVDPALQRLVDAVYSTMERRVGREYEHLLSLTDLFDGCRSLIWLDDTHTTPDGNAMIAERMLRGTRLRDGLRD